MRSTTPRIASVALLAVCGAVMTPAATSAALTPATANATTASTTAATVAVPADLALVRTRQSLLGSHTWYAQTYRGIPVVDGYYAVHTTKGKPSVDDGRKVVSDLASTSPRITKAFATGKTTAHGNALSSRLVVVPGASGAAARLAWEVVTDQDMKVLVDADKGSVTKVTDERIYADGQGKVFDPNPVVALQDESLTDGDNADSAVPASAYKMVTLSNLNGNGYLQGAFATVANKKKGKAPAAYSANNVFSYTRSDSRFEQVNAYFAVDRVQTYIQGLGFTNVNNEAQELLVNTVTVDNSFYSP
ncbi:MAG: bacillolysin, partial [Knoellia sp.]